MAINVSAKESRDLLDEMDVILDVRTPPEFENGHIKGAINIDLMGNFKSDIMGFDMQKTYLVYCRSGSRSAHAVSIMENLGFQNIYHVEHGLLEWDQSL